MQHRIIRHVLFAAILLLFLAGITSTVGAAEIPSTAQSSSTGKPVMGAIRWDFWTKANETWRESQITSGPLTPWTSQPSGQP